MAKKKKKTAKNPARPPQRQKRQPGRQATMQPRPVVDDPNYRGSGTLQDKVAIITGGDSGIGQAVAIAFAKEGADVMVVYLEEHEDALRTKEAVQRYGRQCIVLAGDVGLAEFCQEVVDYTIDEFGSLHILVNNAAEQHLAEHLTDITDEQLERTFRTNIFSQFYLTRAALPHLEKGSAIINTTSVTAYRGSSHLVDYSATKGAIVSFTRSLSLSLASRGIRVNAVAPGPVWTLLIPASYPADAVSKFGSDVPLGRAGEPYEIAPSYVFLASSDASYMSGQVLHPNGGEVING